MIESVQRFFQHDLEVAILPRLGKASVQRSFARLILAARLGLVVSVLTIVIKSLVWLWCRSYKNSSVRALAQDAVNDVRLKQNTSDF